MGQGRTEGRVWPRAGVRPGLVQVDNRIGISSRNEKISKPVNDNFDIFVVLKNCLYFSVTNFIIRIYIELSLFITLPEGV